MPGSLAPPRSRILPLLAVLFGAPIAAEYLQGYMSSTGQALEVLGSLLILGPLYGGAALLIREVAVRVGMGWSGIALLATAFGLAMPGLIDLALFAEHRPEISYWDEMWSTTLIPALGISAYSTLSWVSAHVIMSIGAPLALLAALAPRHRGRKLLGPIGIALLTILWLLAATFIRLDGIKIYSYAPTIPQSLAVAVVVIALGALAWTRAGAPILPTGTRLFPLWPLPLAGAIGIVFFDVVPWTWPGVIALAVLLGAAAIALRLAGRFFRWGAGEIGLLASGTLAGRTALGFFAPLTEGVAREAVVAQNTILIVASLAITWLVYRRARTERAARDSVDPRLRPPPTPRD